MKYIGYLEISGGLGNGIGPFLGGIIYPLIGYAKTMYVFGSCLFLAIIVGILLIPKELNETVSNDELAELE